MDALQVRNRPSAPTTQTRMATDHAIQRGPPEEVVEADGGARLHLLNFSAGVVPISQEELRSAEN